MRFSAIAAAALIAGCWYGCSEDDDHSNSPNRIVDCEVCVVFGDGSGGKDCTVINDVEKHDCEECSSIGGTDVADSLGFTVTCIVK